MSDMEEFWDSEWFDYYNNGGPLPELKVGHRMCSRTRNTPVDVLVIDITDEHIVVVLPYGGTQNLTKDGWEERWEVLRWVSAKDFLQDQINRLHKVLLSTCKNPLEGGDSDY